MTPATVGLSRSFVFYLDGSSSGYVIEPAATQATPELEAQYTPGSGILHRYTAGLFCRRYTVRPGARSDVLTPSLLLSFGVLSTNFTNGQFGSNPTSGRGFGSITATGVPTLQCALQVTPLQVDLMNFGTITTDTITG